MVVKILMIENKDGSIDKDHVAAVNKSGSFKWILNMNPQMDKAIKAFGFPLYFNAVPTENGLSITGRAAGKF